MNTSDLQTSGVALVNDRLLSTEDVCRIMGCHPSTASRYMKESGYALKLHRRVYILESNFRSYLLSLGVA